MKKAIFTLFAAAVSACCFAQVGIGTTTPNSTLDVRGSISFNTVNFTSALTVSATDYFLVFTGTSATTATLPTAVGCTGRSYYFKNASTASATPLLTIATTASQTIDGAASWIVDDANEVVCIVSNGANWNILGHALPNNSGVSWTRSGNSGITTAHFLGTTDDKQMTLKSNNQSFLEFGRRQTLGLTQSMADYNDNNEKVTYVRSALQFEAPGADFYKPKMYTDVNGNFRVKGSSAGTDYFEFGSTGTSNNGGFEFIIGDDGDEPILFKSYHYQNGMSEIMRLQNGRMAVGSNSFNATNPEKLLIDAGVTSSYNLMTGKGSIDNYLQINVQNRSATANASSDLVATADNGDETSKYIDMGINSSLYSNTTYPIISGANTAYLYATGNDFVIGNGTANKSLRFFTGGFAGANESMLIDGNGNVGIGSSSFDATSPEKLLIDAGNDTYTALLAKGNINSYLQINVKNSSTGNQGSSDIVATANNGTETTNFINMGINGSGYVYQTGNPIETGKANDGYLISSGSDFYLVNNNASKDMIFLTGGTAPVNEAMRITANERIAIGTTIPTSTLSVNGSQSVANRVVNGNTTLGSSDYVVINTGNSNSFTLPVASSCSGRVYKIVNHGTGNISLSVSFIQASGSTTNIIGTAAGSNMIEILSDGTNWRRIN